MTALAAWQAYNSAGGSGGSKYQSTAEITPTVNQNPNNSAPFVLDFSGSSNDQLLSTALANPFSNAQSASNNSLLLYLGIAAAVVAIFYLVKK